MRTLQDQDGLIRCAAFASWKNVVDMKNRRLPDLHQTAIRASSLIPLEDSHPQRFWDC